MNINEVKNVKDIYTFMEANINYGFVDVNGKNHVNEMQEFRLNYRTMSLSDILKSGLGTCIEQVWLMKSLMDKIGVKAKMFCARMYEDETFNDLNAKERMHCFLLYYIEDKVHQIEHPNFERKGFYEYESEDVAIDKIVKIYEDMMKKEYEEKNLPEPIGGFKRIVTEFYEVTPGLTYKEFNLYVNSLDKRKTL